MPKASLFDNLDALDEPADSIPTDGRTVPNVQPTIHNLPYRIAIIGEAPGLNEVAAGRPFVGASGYFLDQRLSWTGIARNACLIANIVQHRPPSNDITSFSRSGEEFRYGLEALEKDLTIFNPHICLLLGKTALWAAKGVDAISDWRGSLFIGTQPPFLNRKCIATYHPAACLRQYEWSPLFFFDLKKCLANAKDSSLSLPQRELRISLGVDDIIAELEKIKKEKPLIALDIEGYVDAMSCFSIATSPSHAFIIPLSTKAGTSLWSADDELRLWQAFSLILEDPTIPKVLQNSLYDRFVFQYSYNVVIRGVVDDTMLRHWELYCELEKSLGFQASIYTDEPFYKSERKTDDLETFWTYCCKDSAVTHEINGKLSRYLDEAQDNHYRFNMLLLNPLMYMENRGIRYDSSAAKACLDDVNKHLYALQNGLDNLAGCGFDFHSPDRVAVARSIMGFKKNPMQPKKAFEESYDEVVRILSKDSSTVEEQGFVSATLGTTMNIKSPMFKAFIYDTLQLPKQYKTDPHTKEQRLSADYESLLLIQKRSPHPAVSLALEIGTLRTRSQMLQISSDKDGRVRCGYNLVGTETGRLTCYTSPTGSGYNLQTIPSTDKSKPEGHPLRKGMRHLFQADEGYYMFQCDLSGADGWTVAAHLASLGDRTMLDDYFAGIKPAKVLCYLLRNGAASLSGKTREEIKTLTGPIKSSDWDYFASKIGQHGTCYLMGPIKLATQLFIQSEGKVNFTSNETRDLQRLFNVRYRVKLWHDWMSRQLSKEPVLRTCSGYKRRFFGRSREILGEALAFEPQANTTYATNLAMYKLWTDKENRLPLDGSKPRSVKLLGNTTESVSDATGVNLLLRTLPSNGGSCRLRIEPLHQVHDALVCQAKIEDTDWAVTKLKSYFNNPIIIANQKIVIPFEGAYGPSWGELNFPIK